MWAEKNRERRFETTAQRAAAIGRASRNQTSLEMSTGPHVATGRARDFLLTHLSVKEGTGVKMTKTHKKSQAKNYEFEPRYLWISKTHILNTVLLSGHGFGDLKHTWGEKRKNEKRHRVLYFEPAHFGLLLCGRRVSCHETVFGKTV